MCTIRAGSLVVVAIFVSSLAGTDAHADGGKAACVAATDKAQDLRTARKLLEAREALLECAQPSCPNVIRKDCTRWLAEVDDGLPSVVIRARDSSGRDATAVRVSIDGVVATERLDGQSLTVDPGMRVFRYELAGGTPVEEKVLIAEGQKSRALDVQFRAAESATPPTEHASTSPGVAEIATGVESSGSPRRVAAYVLGGIAVLAAGSFAYLGVRGESSTSTLSSGCGATKSCTAAQVDSVRSELIVADISLGVGIVSLGTAALLFFIHPSAKPRDATGASTFRVFATASTHDGKVEAQWVF